jgi:hypothetical protein
LKAVSDAVLRECDALDGLWDGMINDVQACHFDPKSVVCGTRGAPGARQCLSAAQAGALKAIFGGARNSRGKQLYGTFPFDTGIASSIASSRPAKPFPVSRDRSARFRRWRASTAAPRTMNTASRADDRQTKPSRAGRLRETRLRERERERLA